MRAAAADSRESPEKTSTFLTGTGICYVGNIRASFRPKYLHMFII
jgi:hypothetical protein